MNAITLMATVASSMLAGLHVGDRDGLWEVTCAPHSWLSRAAQEHELRPRVINLRNGYDLYKPDTWDQLRDLRQRKKPMKIWFSLPCTKWCLWNSMNYKNSGREEQLETARRRERMMLWQVNREWPTQRVGWSQHPMEDLREYMDNHDQPWVNCRIDGCRYGLREGDDGGFVQKRWTIKTNDENFHRVFRAKVCAGGHRHSHFGGSEWTVSTYYPWNWCNPGAGFGATTWLQRGTYDCYNDEMIDQLMWMAPKTVCLRQHSGGLLR
eukprot:s1736_g13.t1